MTPLNQDSQQDGRQDRIVKENPVDEIFKEMGLTQEQVREAFQRIRDERGEPYGSHLDGRVDEICETCCDEHLQIIFQRTTKVVAKGKASEVWYATVGTMTVRKLTKTDRTIFTQVPLQAQPAFSVETFAKL